MTTTRTVDRDRTGTPPALLWLAIAAFSTGIDGYVLAGLLPQIATGLRVSEALAGQLVAVFALTAAIAAPVLGTVTGGWERRRTIATALAVFVLGNLIVASAPGYGFAMAGRVVSALGASLLNATMTAYVIEVAPAHQRGRALSFVLGGWMTATALGVPVGLVLGQANWRFPLVMVSVVGSVALAGILVKLPTLHTPTMTLAQRLRPLRQPRLVFGLLVTTGILMSSYTCFTYAVLILGPHFPQSAAIVVIMFGYGLASMFGNAISGRLADRFTPVRVLTCGLVGLLANAVFGFVALGVTGTAAGVLGLIWFGLAGIGNGGSAVPQQARLASLAPESAPIVMALNGSAISLGSALGSGLGGAVLNTGAAPRLLLGVAAIILTLTVVNHLFVSFSRRSA